MYSIGDASIDNLQEIKPIAMHTTYDLYKNNQREMAWHFEYIGGWN